ncbi:autotransporter outer membrane beta-barrel domain-containing protein [Paraburkholderia edwinii]|uniref:Autotransporter outer membrane beta-barrel domain-containing protein n=1 Tax=Paraburkholderia edwinii TaxID=2861782 RepID=A0ABX8UGP8_9BURK|nr:autotransporter outer membrane beta-barrel domain-containing protein [Paraburkholderia edwinii]QYD67994.1 autotransporter outer membrane beta-barrel domain-containing protein [Paraburkholderia edwinii]
MNNQTDLANAIAAINSSTDASSTIRFGSGFQVTGNLTTPNKPITLDTQGFTLTTSGDVWSGPVTIVGTVVSSGTNNVGGASFQLTSPSGSTPFVNNGSLTGGGAGAGQTGGIGILLNGTRVTLTNNGTISGGSSLTTGAPGPGVEVENGAALTNSGTILGGNTNGGVGAVGIGVTWGPGGGTLINHGTIRGGSDLTGANVGGAGIFLRAGASPVVNTGTIVGGNGAAAVSGNAAISLINSGTLQAGAGQANAIQFTGGTGALSLELQAGSTIVGNVIANTASSANTLTLGGTANDVFDVSSIGSAAQYRNFNVFQKTGTSTWALTGTGTAATPWFIQQGTLQIGNGGTSGSVLGAITDNATLAFNRSDAFTFGNLVSGTGSVNQVGTGITVLTAANTYSGGTNVLAGTLAVGDAAHANATIGSGLTTVAAGATLGGYGTVSGSVNNSGTIAAANALSPFASGNTGAFSIGGNLNNAGIVNLAAASGRIGNVLNVAGNYTGTNGQVVLNTLLNEGGPASQSDRLVVGGNVSGTTTIKLNQSGAGAQTVGDGIQLVQVNGTSAANSFHLAGPVQAGAFQYMLFQGGATDVNDWYLRSQLAAQTAPGDTSDPTAPPPASAAATGPIAYRPAVVGYSVTPLLNADYGFSLLGRLHERVGDIPNADSTQPAHNNGVWGRIGGQNLSADANDRFSADEHTFFAQFGKDWTLSHDASGGSTHAGATLAFGSTSANFSDSARNIPGTSDSTGTVETQGQSIGGYWTRYLPDGSYFDGVGQLTHYQNRYGDIFGDSSSQNGFGAGVSGEIGKPFALGSTGVAIEPQAQLLYQYLHLNSFDDGVSPISSNTTNGLRGRLGFRLFKANLGNDSKTSSVTPYFTADVLHDFFSPGQTTVGGTSFGNELEKTWYDIGIGITGSIGKHSEAYANVKYEHSWGGEYRRNVFGQAGYRFSW